MDIKINVCVACSLLNKFIRGGGGGRGEGWNVSQFFSSEGIIRISFLFVLMYWMKKHATYNNAFFLACDYFKGERGDCAYINIVSILHGGVDPFFECTFFVRCPSREIFVALRLYIFRM